MNLFELYAKIGVDTNEYERGIKKSRTSFSKFSAFTIAQGQLIADAIKKGGAALIGFGKSAISSYADYEQLEGGIKKLFGEDDMKSVISNANQAYKTAGMSANKYLETTTSFAASLISGLGGDTKKAAEYADMAIRDMSDNANTFGTDITLIQNAYQNFAKQNYQLLDNLRLGYSGTASEMARLINDSGVLGDTVTVTASNINHVSFDKIIEAINVTQERMGILGTTTNESGSTISGSIETMKASWENLKLAVASNGDVETALSEFGSSVSTVWENLKPAIVNTIDAIWTTTDNYITESKFGDYWVDIKNKVEDAKWAMDDYLDRLEKDDTTTQEGIALATLAGILATVATALGLVTVATTAQTVAAKAAAIAQGALNAVMNLNPFVLIASLIAGVTVALITLWNTNEGFRDFCKTAWEEIKNFGVNAWNGIKNGWNGAKEWGKSIVDNIKNGISEKWDSLKNWFKEKLTGLFDIGGSSGSSDSGGWFKGLFNGSHADGLAYVPFDGYVAELHKGERVLTAKEAKAYNAGAGGGTNNISITINGANYSDERSLAEAVANALQNVLDRRNAAYA